MSKSSSRNRSKLTFAAEQALKPVPRGVSDEALASFYESICNAVNSDVARACLKLFREKKWDELVNFEISAQDYNNSQAFADDYLVSKMLSKYQDFKHENLKPAEAAMKTFWEAEGRCKETNNRFSLYERDPSKMDPFMRGILLNAKRKISYVLGKVNLESLSNGFGWGPGATTSCSGNRTSAYIKFKARLDVTSNCLIMGHCCINSIPSWVNCQLQTDSFPSQEVSLSREALFVVRGNEVVLVPKNAKTERTIAKEPHVNSYVQRGFGRYFRSRLLKYAGIDLLDQSVNQRLAQVGSSNGSIATMDLKTASGTISREVVRFLLPDKWFALLDMVRSKQGYLREKNEWIYFQQFSSMGNGFTFELESLLFWALCSSAQDQVKPPCRILNVYGDDIAIDTESYSLAGEVLEFAGFEVNKKKSFFEGPFRESCGKDYFRGTSVRPFFIKRTLSNVQELYKLANSLRRYSHSRNFNYGCDLRFRTAWSDLIERIPPELRDLKIPEGSGDGGLVSNFDEAVPSLSRPQGGMEGYLVKQLVHSPGKEMMKDSHAGYTSKLYESGAEMPSLNFHSLRKMTHPKIASIHTHEWYDLGPWC